jgi:hypothetical protein
VLWFHDDGNPKRRRRIICTHCVPKVKTKEFQKEIVKAARLRAEYIAAKTGGVLIEPPEPKEAMS